MSSFTHQSQLVAPDTLEVLKVHLNVGHASIEHFLARVTRLVARGLHLAQLSKRLVEDQDVHSEPGMGRYLLAKEAVEFPEGARGVHPERSDVKIHEIGRLTHGMLQEIL